MAYQFKLHKNTREESLNDNVINKIKTHPWIKPAMTKNDLQYQCNICELRFQTARILREHYKERHDN